MAGKYTTKKSEYKNEKEQSMEEKKLNEEMFESGKEQETVVAEKKPNGHRFLKKVLLTVGLIAAVSACSFLAACNKTSGKTTTNENSGPNIEQSEDQGNNSGNQGEFEQGGQTGGETGGQTGGEQTGGNQGGQTGGQTGGETGGQTGGQETGGETGGEVTPDPEKTPAEYKAECEEKITNAVAEALQAKYVRSKASDIELVKMNAKDGTIYAKASHTLNGSTTRYFYSIKSNLGDISKNTYKEISQKCDSLTLLSIDIERNTILKSEITEEKYNDLCNYVLADVGLEGGTVLNATEFGSAADGMRGTTLTVLYNNKIATINANCYSATTDNVQCIDNMLSKTTNDIRITSYEDYKDFDYLNNEATMSAVSYNLNLGGKTVATKTASGTFINMNLSEDFCQ